MSRNKGKLSIIILFLISCRILFPQSNTIKLSQIGIEQGLSQSTIFAITQDKKGFLWFGTDDGLNKYDGYTVTVFKNNNSDSNSISDNSVLSLLCDRKGNIWVGTRLGGVDRYVPSINKFFHYKHVKNDTSTIIDNSVNAIYEDSKGNIWFGTNRGLSRYNFEKDNLTSFLINSSKIAIIRTICEDNNRNLWIGTSDGIFRMNLNESSSAKKIIEPILLKGTYIRSIFFDYDDKLWIGTYGNGLYRYDTNTKTLKRSTLESTPGIGKFISCFSEDIKHNLWIASYDSGLSVLNYQSEKYQKLLKEPVMTLYKGRSNILWLGTFTDGVKMHDERVDRFNHYFVKTIPEKNNRNLVTSILESKDGRLWVGTYGGGLDLYSAKKKSEWNPREKIKTFRFDPNNQNSISGNRVVAICESINGDVFVGTENDGLNYIEEETGKIIRYKEEPGNFNSLSTNRITTLFYDTQMDLLWIGHLNGNLDTYNKSKNLFSHYELGSSITAIIKNSTGKLWIGTFSGDLFSFDPYSDSYKKHKVSLSKTNFLKNAIYSIHEDDEGILWLGTHGSGLIRVDPSKNSVKNYTENNGLPNNTVYGILNDNFGNLWLSTNEGLSKFNPVDETFRNYDDKDGLQSNEFNQGAFFSGSDGELFFGGVNGFNSFYPDSIKDNQYIPPVYFTKFKILIRIYNFLKLLHIPNKLYSLTRRIFSHLNLLP